MRALLLLSAPLVCGVACAPSSPRILGVAKTGGDTGTPPPSEAAERALEACPTGADAPVDDGAAALARLGADLHYDHVAAITGVLQRLGAWAADLSEAGCFTAERGDGHEVYAASSPCALGDLGEPWGTARWTGSLAVETAEEDRVEVSFAGLEVEAGGVRVALDGQAAAHRADTVSTALALTADLTAAGALFAVEPAHQGLAGTFAARFTAGGSGHVIEVGQATLDQAPAGVPPGTACTARFDTEHAVVGDRLVELAPTGGAACYAVTVDGEAAGEVCE